MAVTRYHRYIGELWEDLNLEELVSELSDFLLHSGFGQEMGEWDDQVRLALAPGEYTLSVGFESGTVQRKVLITANTEPVFEFAAP